MILFQEPADPSTTESLAALSWLGELGWVDRTALGVMLVFFVLGLFKGLIWQVSRIGILVAAYLVAGRWGHDVAGLLASEPAGPTAGAAATEAAPAAGALAVGPSETTLYLAYCLLFVAVLVVLSLLAMLIKKLADKAGLGFFDRLGGGVLGVATGGCVVLALVFVVHMFFPNSELARAAERSHSLDWSKRAIELLHTAVHDDLRSVLALPPLQHEPGAGASGGSQPPQPAEASGDRTGTWQLPASESGGEPRPGGGSGGGSGAGPGGGGR